MTWYLNENNTVLEKNLTEEKKTDIDVAPVHAIVESSKEAAPVVLSQTPPILPSDPKLAFDKASSIVAHPLGKKK